MIIKFFGLFMVVGSCFLAGVSIYKKYHHRTMFLQNYINFIVYLKNEINYTRASVCSIFKNYNNSSYLKKYILKLLQNLKYESLDCSWNRAFEGISKENGLLKEEETTILDFGKQLGVGDLETQINILDYHIKMLDVYLKEAYESKKSKGNLPIVLALCLGLFIAIIFI